MKIKRLVLAGALAAAGALTLASCGNENITAGINKYTGATADNDDDIYAASLGAFKSAYDAALESNSNSERYAAMAKAEAKLLASGVFLPTTTRGGSYAITRVAPRTGSYALWGTDEYRYKNLLITKELIKKSDRDALLTSYNNLKGTGNYHATAESYLTSHNYTLKDEYRYPYSELNQTWDWLNTSEASDSEVLTNLVDGLVEYDGENNLVPALAESVPTGVYDSTTNKTTYTFHIKQGLKWVNATDGTESEYTLKADDFVAGFQHMLDAQAGLEYLVDGVIDGAHEYLAGKVGFENVGVKATDDYTLVYTVVGNPSYFLTYLAYNIFQPMNRAYFESKGGKFGSEYATASASDSYKYGKTKDDVLSIGAYYCQQWNDGSTVTFKQNTKYWAVTDADTTNDPKIKTITWVYEDGKDASKTYNDAISGTLDGAALNTTTLTQAKSDGKFDTYAYVSDTNATTYISSINMNRQTYQLSNGKVKSKLSKSQAKDAITAAQNKNFRLALNRAFDKATWNAVQVGDDLKLNSLRNMYTPYDFVSITDEVTFEGKTWEVGTNYGEIVQYYIEKEGLTNLDLHDSNNSWYNTTEANKYMEAAKAELEGKLENKSITIEIMYYSASPIQTAQAAAYKKSIEDAFGGFVKVNTIKATTLDDYYACGYRASTGADGNYNVFYGSGWGPDYGDPSTYLETFYGQGGYMAKTLGIYGY